MTNPTPFPDLSSALAGQYAIEHEIGRGGMGIVYRARDLKLDRLVAIKTLPPHLAGDAAIRERFLREARTAASLSHPNIVPVHRADEIAGHVFFVMGYVDGESLAARIARGPLPPRDVARYMSDVASGLAYAHSRQVVHRDVKAENILLDGTSGRAMVTDFGIARLAEAAPLTATGQMLGTVYYLSPEQIAGDHVDARSDIYSLGVVGYFGLSGRFPFDGALASAVLIAHVNKSVPPLRTRAPGVPPLLASVVERCLSKDPNHRYQSCEELIGELAGLFPRVEPRSTGLPAVTPLVSDTEVHAILHRAAELDDATGTIQRPLAIPRPRDLARDDARTSGLRVDQVRDAAIEAGIAPRHVEHALVEHGLTRSPNAQIRESVLPIVVDVSPGSESLVFGGHTELQYEVVVDGEMPSADFDILVETLRRRTNNEGRLYGTGRSLRWEPARPHFLLQPIGERAPRGIEVAVLPANGKTSVFVRESLAGDAGRAVLLAALVTPLLWALTEGAMVDITGHGVGGILVKVWFILAGIETVGVVAGVRYLFGRISRKRQAFLRGLAETLGVRARDSAAAATSGLAPGRAPKASLEDIVGGLNALPATHPEDEDMTVPEGGERRPDQSALDALLAIRDTIATHRTGLREIDTLLEKAIGLSLAIVTGGEGKRADEPRPTAAHSPAASNLELRLKAADERLAEDPSEVEPWFERACMLAELGNARESRNALLECLIREPAHEGALNTLGLMMQEQGFGAAARLAFGQAVAHHPDHALGHINLARVLREQDSLDEARAHLETALRLEPESMLAHQGLVQVLTELGETEAAASYQAKCFQDQPIFALPYVGSGPPVTVMVLQSVSGGNVRTEFLLDNRVFRVFMVVAELYDPAVPFPAHQLVFNAIGDAERSPAGLAAAESLLAHETSPVVNPPSAIPATERVANGRRLANLPGVVVPAAATLSREQLLGPDVGRTLGHHGIAFPLLVRAPGFHTGRNFVRVEDARALSATVADLPGRELIVSQFVDTRGPDGNVRKYRVMMVGGQLYPLHAAIASDWKVHYFTAHMADHPERRAEEAEFLDDMPKVLGSRAMAGLAHVEATLGLDYAGIDFALTAGGEILVFEANATMVVLPPKPGRRWAYRRPAAERIFAAVRGMLLERARVTPSA